MKKAYKITLTQLGAWNNYVQKMIKIMQKQETMPKIAHKNAFFVCLNIVKNQEIAHLWKIITDSVTAFYTPALSKEDVVVNWSMVHMKSHECVKTILNK